MFDILYHNDLDIQSVEKTFPKTLKQLQAGDFKSADFRKMSGTDFYRIKDHNYSRSHFLRDGAQVDEDRLARIESPEKEIETATIELPYIHPENKAIHTLNKFLSFDQFQQTVFLLHPPLIIAGSAGSGKTALVLEKLKGLKGNVAYISVQIFSGQRFQSILFLRLRQRIAGDRFPFLSRLYSLVAETQRTRSLFQNL